MPLETSLILLAVFCSTGLAQTCLNCTKLYSNNTCPLQGCSSSCVGMNVFWGGVFSSLQNSTCPTPSTCQNGSFNLGSEGFTSNFQCCPTPLSCTNTVIPPEWLQKSPNGLKCFTCTGSNCSQTLACQADENQCMTVGVGNVTQKGCSSQEFCNTPSLFSHFLPNVDARAVNVGCCSKNLCNAGNLGKSAWRATYGFSMLMAALVLTG